MFDRPIANPDVAFRWQAEHGEWIALALKIGPGDRLSQAYVDSRGAEKVTEALASALRQLQDLPLAAMERLDLPGLGPS